MARTVDPAVHRVRRDAFIDAAQRLMQERGWAETSVQDVLDAVDASRGAFYHYFDSKAALLEAVIDRMVDEGLASLEPVVSDPALTALQKLDGIFRDLARFKAARTELLVELLRVWRSDENAAVREQFRRHANRTLVPLLARIVRQGQSEGFTATSADGAADVLTALILGLNETATDLYLARQAGMVTLEAVRDTVAAFIEAFERILGAPAGSLALLDEATIRAWYA